MNKGNMRRLLALALAAALALAGCGGGGNGGQEGGSGKTNLVMSTSVGEPGNLHPYATNNAGVKNSIGSVYECLFQLSGDGSEVLPGIGESWEWSEDNMQLTIHLRQGVKFHNGEELKASDVAFSIRQWGEFSTPRASLNDSVDFENVSFKYRAEAKEFALSDVNLHIAAGQTVGILGGTGAAKTTLVQLIPRLYDAVQGKVCVGGHDVREYDLNVLRDAVGIE